MSMFDLGKDVKLEKDEDRLSTSGILDSDIYDFKIEMAYLTKSKGGAMAVNLVLKQSNGHVFKPTIYISSGDAKGNSFTYTDKKTGEMHPLPGFSQINTLCELAIDKGLKDLEEPEKKTIGIWNYDAKKEMPTEVPVLMELLNSEITAGVLKIIEDKRAKNDVGDYVPTGETREINEIDKLFRTEGRLSSAEIIAGNTQGEFASKWADKNAGKTRNKSSGSTASSGTAGAPVASEAPTTTKKLFG